MHENLAAKKFLITIQDFLADDDNKEEHVYDAIGNYLFVSSSKNHKTQTVEAEYHDLDQINSCMATSDELCSADPGVEQHLVDSYEKCLSAWKGRPITFSTEEKVHIMEDYLGSIDRTVTKMSTLTPRIESAELIRVQAKGKNDRLRLQLTGKHLSFPILDQCRCNFGFLFGQDIETRKVSQAKFSINL